MRIAFQGNFFYAELSNCYISFSSCTVTASSMATTHLQLSHPRCRESRSAMTNAISVAHTRPQNQLILNRALRQAAQQ